MREISAQEVETFIEGKDPQERIVNLDYKYQDDFIKIFYRNENDEKCISSQPFYPFVWAKLRACLKLCNGDKEELKKLMAKYNIGVKALSVTNINGEEIDEMKDGYRYMFFAKTPMSYSTFLEFFKKGKCPVYSKDSDKTIAKKDDKLYLSVTPQEQFLISTGKRFFKGYDDYNQVLRMIFDLETEGLDPKKDRIKLDGIRLNRPVTYKGKTYQEFNRIFRIEGETEEEKDASELKVIDTMFKVIYTFSPDIITAHNGENFDWNFIIERCNQLGTSIEAMSSKYFNGESILKDKRESVLKLGGEMEHFHRTIVPGIIVTDSLHAVRRAQALDSNMLRADLKYVTKYSEMVKPNRVYVPGEIIDKTLCDLEERYAFNDVNGDWYIYDPFYVEPKKEVQGVIENFGKKEEPTKAEDKFVLVTRNEIKEGYTLVSGEYIVERYLYDDLWECDMVEYRYNTPNFLICKMLPVPFAKCCTMGTAGQWKSLLLAWSYENNLAIPQFAESKSFTGGLSRLLSVGFVDNVAKFDYNSLYPSIILTWAVSDRKDLMNTMLAFLEHVLTQREKYKKLKKQASKKAEAIKERLQNRDYASKEEGEALRLEMLKWKSDESFNDKKQLPLKILGNSFFGSYGAPNVFPWGSIDCAERTTCTGRQSLRLMIYWFTQLGYKPIVGDSFTPDTPLFIKYNDSGYIDIKPISELINENEIKIDELGREYDYSKKDYKILCRSGWIEPSYIYRHKTDKDINEITDGDTMIDVTEDHSLFNSDKTKIKPSEIDENTKLEYYKNEIKSDNLLRYRRKIIHMSAINTANGVFDRIPFGVLNSDNKSMKLFYRIFMENYKDDIKYSKTCLAGLQYLKKMIHTQ